MYCLWARVWWADSKSNSLAVACDGHRVARLGKDGTYGKWHWVGGNYWIKCRAGANTFVLKDMKPGAKIDRFFLTDRHEISGSMRPSTAASQMNAWCFGGES